MATYNHEDSEQIEALKAWWKQHGQRTINILTALVLVVVSWQGWNWYQNKQENDAFILYDNLRTAAVQGQQQQVREMAGKLIDEHANSPKTHLGIMMAARLAFDKKDLKTAKARLSWVIDKADGELRDLARINLANVLLDEKAFDEAMAQVESAESPGFEPGFKQFQGDILLAQGEKEKARKAYKEALDLYELTNEAWAEKLSGVDQGLDGPKMLPSNHVEAIQILIQQKYNALGGDD